MDQQNQEHVDPALHFDPVESVIEAFRKGELVIVTDDEKRENEGDLIFAAERVTPESIQFMARHGRGLICVAMESRLLGIKGLSRMPRHGIADSFATAFMESVDAINGVTTGISAHDRARTIEVLIDPEKGPQTLRTPGHVFPLEAVEGGTLRRAGHTEAAVDLARLAGLVPAGVICEMISDDGRMARLPELEAFAAEHGLKITSVADLVAYRRTHEVLITLDSKSRLPTKYGAFELRVYHSDLSGEDHIAMVMGDLSAQEAPLVRLHSECLTGDVFGSMRCDCGLQLEQSLELIANEGSGVVLYMRQEGRGIGLAKKIHAYALQDRGLDTVEANEKLGFDADLRDYGISAQMLKDLGIQHLRLITNNPAKIIGLQRYGIEVVERVPSILPSTEHNERYLETKKNKMGHML